MGFHDFTLFKVDGFNESHQKGVIDDVVLCKKIYVFFNELVYFKFTLQVYVDPFLLVDEITIFFYSLAGTVLPSDPWAFKVVFLCYFVWGVEKVIHYDQIKDYLIICRAVFFHSWSYFMKSKKPRHQCLRIRFYVPEVFLKNFSHEIKLFLAYCLNKILSIFRMIEEWATFSFAHQLFKRSHSSHN